MAEVGVLVLGGGLYLFSGVTMGLGCTTTFSAGGGGGGGGATAKSSESVRSKLIMCSFRFSAGFFGRAASNCTKLRHFNLVNSMSKLDRPRPRASYLLLPNLTRGSSCQGPHLDLSNKSSSINTEKINPEHPVLPVYAQKLTFFSIILFLH